MHTGGKLDYVDFTQKCFPRGDANWHFSYPPDGLLPLHGLLSDELMRQPDMWDVNKERCLLVVKNGGATGTTIGRATGARSITRNYSGNMTPDGTSMEWLILNSDKSDSGIFSKGGDSGAVVADIRGRVGGMITGGSGSGRDASAYDTTYATPIWWLLQRIRTSGFPNARFEDLT